MRNHLMTESKSAEFARRFFDGMRKYVDHVIGKRDERIAALEKRVDELETLQLERMERDQ